MVTFRNVLTARDAVLGLRVPVPAGTVRCPDCDWPLAVDEDVEAFHPLTGARRVVRALGVCGGCGFTHEIT